jgi:ABC-type Fe3+/spermidine/putrescine transport system ATPase subunit/ABC-type sulfate transport system permease component
VTRRTLGSPLAWLGGLLVVYLVVPVVAFLVRAAGSRDRGFGVPGLWGALGVSVESATIATALVALVGIPLAHALARSRGRLAGAVGIAVQLPLALPPLMSGIVLIYLVGPYTFLGRLFDQHLTGSVAGVVIAQSFVSAPFLVIAARSAFRAVDPALDDVAATLGHGPLARFVRVDLAAAAPGIAAGMLLGWLRAFGEYGATVLLSYHPYSLPVYTDVQFSGTGLPATQAPTLLALGVAALAVGLGATRWPRRRQAPSLPVPSPPAIAAPAPLAFDLDVHVGTFHLRAAHRSTSHRLAIVGPSGSGKSLTLRSLAGLLGPAAGAVAYGERDVTGLPAERRGIGLVPQGLGLLPRRPVWQQLRFAPGADPQVAAWWLATLQLDGLEGRRPDQLSGGQRQRVSLAQALSVEPSLVLLDEPFSALDTPVRRDLRRQVRQLQQERGLSTVLVTHDPEEAALLADELLVMVDGRVLQAGPCREVFARPRSPEVAHLLGMANVLAGVADVPGVVRADEVLVGAAHGEVAGAPVWWSVHPADVTVCPGGRYPARLLDRADLGAELTAVVELDGGPSLEVRTRQFAHLAGLPIGGPCAVDLDPDAVRVWPAGDEHRAEATDRVPGPAPRPRLEVTPDGAAARR